MKKVSSIIYRGPSMIDNAPIAVVAIIDSTNGKTGSMLQTHIIRDDIKPMEAIRTGQDRSICGDCIHRGIGGKQRSCYVMAFQGPTSVYKKLHSENPYPVCQDLTELGDGEMIRIGSYGDPAAVPHDVWNKLTARAYGVTAYSHAKDLRMMPAHCMLSADDVLKAKLAQAMGKRTFRVIPVSEWQFRGMGALLQNEILCPASTESEQIRGKKIQCKQCLLCDGRKSGKSIAIVAHGAGADNFKSF